MKDINSFSFLQLEQKISYKVIHCTKRETREKANSVWSCRVWSWDLVRYWFEATRLNDRSQWGKYPNPRSSTCDSFPVVEAIHDARGKICGLFNDLQTSIWMSTSCSKNERLKVDSQSYVTFAAKYKNRQKQLHKWKKKLTAVPTHGLATIQYRRPFQVK